MHPCDGACRSYFSNGFALKFVGFFLLFMVFLFVVYNAVISTPYAHHDDYYFFVPDEYGNHPQIIEIQVCGRQVYAWLVRAYQHSVTSLADLTTIRFIGLLYVGIAATLFAIWLLSIGFKSVQGFLLSLAVFTLPGVQALAGWAMASPFLIPISLSIVAALLLQWATTAGARTRIHITPTNAIAILTACMALTIAMFIYPPTTMFFVVTITSIALFSDGSQKHVRRQAVLYVTVLFIAIALWYLMHSFVFYPDYVRLWPEHVENIARGGYAFKVTAEFAEKIRFFTRVLTPKAISLWDITCSSRTQAFVVATIVMGLLVHVARDVGLALRGRKAFRVIARAYAGALLFLGAVLALANLPTLAAAASVSPARVLIPYSAIIVLLCVWSGCRLMDRWHFRQDRIILIVATVLALWGVYTARANTQRHALLAGREIEYIRDNLERALVQGDVRGVHVVRPRAGACGVYGPSEADELALPSSGFWQDVPHMVKVANSLLRQPLQEVVVSSGGKDGPVPRMPGTLVIDMNDFCASYRERNSTSLAPHNAQMDSDPVIEASGQTACGPLGRAFDGQAVTYWEVVGPFPHWLLYDLGRSEKRTLVGYAFSQGVVASNDEVGSRTPKAWEVYASDDGISWVMIDKHSNEGEWKSSERRSYLIQHPASFRRYKFIFLEGTGNVSLRLYELQLRFAPQ